MIIQDIVNHQRHPVNRGNKDGVDLGSRTKLQQTKPHRKRITNKTELFSRSRIGQGFFMQLCPRGLFYVCLFVCNECNVKSHMYVCMYVRMHVCTYARIYVCLYESHHARMYTSRKSGHPHLKSMVGVLSMCVLSIGVLTSIITKMQLRNKKQPCLCQ